MKKINWLWVALLLFTAVSLACQLSSVDLPQLEADKLTQPEFPEFIPPEKGSTRANPLPVDESITMKNWTIEVLQFMRGQEAWEQLKPLSSHNNPPRLGEEYVLMQLRVTHSNQFAEPESVGIALTGSEGLKYQSFRSNLTPPTPYLPTTDIEGGASSEGWYAFVIGEDETDLMLVVDDYSDYEEPNVYAALEEGASLLVPTAELTAVQPTNRGTDFREPAPFGSTLINEDWEVTLTDVIKGDEAWQMLLEANQFNDPPESDTEYMLVKVKVRYIGQGDKDFDMAGYHFEVLNEAGEAYANPSLVEPDPWLDFNMYPGAEAEGWLGLAVFKDESEFVLRFNPTFADDSPEVRYLSLDASGR